MSHITNTTSYPPITYLPPGFGTVVSRSLIFVHAVVNLVPCPSPRPRLTFGLLALFAMLGGMERQTFSFGSSSPYYYYYLPFQTVNLQDAGPARKGRANTVRSTGVQYVVQVCAPAARELEARTDITHPRGRSTHPNSGRRLVTRTQHETCPI